MSLCLSVNNHPTLIEEDLTYVVKMTKVDPFFFKNNNIMYLILSHETVDQIIISLLIHYIMM